MECVAEPKLGSRLDIAVPIKINICKSFDYIKILTLLLIYLHIVLSKIFIILPTVRIHVYDNNDRGHPSPTNSFGVVSPLE